MTASRTTASALGGLILLSACVDGSIDCPDIAATAAPLNLSEAQVEADQAALRDVRDAGQLTALAGARAGQGSTGAVADYVGALACPAINRRAISSKEKAVALQSVTDSVYAALSND